MGRIANSLLLLAASAAPVFADLTCQQWHPFFDNSSSIGQITFRQQDFEITNYYSFQAGNPVNVKQYSPDSSSSGATKLQIQSCSSKSFNFGPSRSKLQRPCDGDNSFFYVFNTVRVINPTTGNCLDIRPAKEGNNRTELFFQKCNSNPKTTSQFFRTVQGIASHCDGRPIEIGGDSASFYPWTYYPSLFDPNNNNGPYTPWIIGSDGHSLVYLPEAQGNPNYLFPSLDLVQ